MKKRIASLFTLIVTPFILTGCFGFNILPDDPRDMSVFSIELNSNTSVMHVGDSKQITATSYNSNFQLADSQDVTWSIADSSLAKIDSYTNNTVTISALKLGSTVLTATSNTKNSIKVTATIKVTDEDILEKTKLNDSYKTFVKQNYDSISSAPTTGTTKSLIIPVWFTDSAQYIQNRKNVRNDIETTYLGSESDTGWQSVKTYYERESRGTLKYEGVVSDWFECNQPSTRYYVDDSQANTTRALVRKAVDWYASKVDSAALKDFDRDNDGYIDSVMLIYGAPDCAAYENNNDNMWAYCFWLATKPNYSIPNANVFFWASYDFMYDKKTAKSRAGTEYANGDCSYCNVDSHTFVHEMGHVFGLYDYYDYSKQYIPAGGFSMQDYNVGSHDPYSRMALGWDDPYVPTSSCKLHIDPYQSSGDLVLLSSNPDSFSHSNFDEYILLELYTPTVLNSFDVRHAYSGHYPTGAKSAGIRIWHVDSRLIDMTGIRDDSQIKPSLIRRGFASGRTYTLAMSNTYGGGTDSYDYETKLGPTYTDYNVLQLIHNSSIATYRCEEYFNDGSLFKTGSKFKLSSYSKQFVNGVQMNDGSSFGWEVEFNLVTGLGAELTITRL